MALSASIKVCDPASVPASILADLNALRAELRGLRQENERLRQDNERLRRELDQTRAELDQARRQSKRQAAPFSKGQPKAQPGKPGRKRGAARDRHGHRPPPPPERVDETLEAPLPDACPRCGGPEFVSQTLRAFGNPLLARPILLTPRSLSKEH